MEWAREKEDKQKTRMQVQWCTLYICRWTMDLWWCIACITQNRCDLRNTKRHHHSDEAANRCFTFVTIVILLWMVSKKIIIKIGRKVFIATWLSSVMNMREQGVEHHFQDYNKKVHVSVCFHRARNMPFLVIVSRSFARIFI